MCGIIGIASTDDVVTSLVQGLKRMEYRGYDSAGVLVQETETGALVRCRVLGRVSGLEAALAKNPLQGTVGIGHTRWATHGAASVANAHPHCSHDQVALVHNGIVENYQALRQELIQEGFSIQTDTDTEVVVHALYRAYTRCGDPVEAILQLQAELVGTYALAIVFQDIPGTVFGVHMGSPLLLGVGGDAANPAHFLVSDPWALAGSAARIAALEYGDIALVHPQHFTICDRQKQVVQRAWLPAHPIWEPAEMGPGTPLDPADPRSGYRHFMQKEIAEQPVYWSRTWQGWEAVRTAWSQRPMPRHIHMVACGSSYHAGLCARYFFEQAGISTQVEVASEYRYRQVVVPEGTWLIAISQSGETADTLAALQKAADLPYAERIVIVNVPGSAMTRLPGHHVLYTHAGMEIGVASTKAFTTQLLLLLVLATHRDPSISPDVFATLPHYFQALLDIEPQIRLWAAELADKQHALFLGRGMLLPIAQEGALKLKEISYIHAEAYPAGELKHGPLALVDPHMPVLALAPRNTLLLKMTSNLEEVRARGGRLYVLSDDPAILANPDFSVIAMPPVPAVLVPVVYTVPLQWLAYHVAVLRGTDVDCPRNLAKSVTVE